MSHKTVTQPNGNCTYGTSHDQDHIFPSAIIAGVCRASRMKSHQVKSQFHHLKVESTHDRVDIDVLRGADNHPVAGDADESPSDESDWEGSIWEGDRLTCDWGNWKANAVGYAPWANTGRLTNNLRRRSIADAKGPICSSPRKIEDESIDADNAVPSVDVTPCSSGPCAIEAYLLMPPIEPRT